MPKLFVWTVTYLFSSMNRKVSSSDFKPIILDMHSLVTRRVPFWWKRGCFMTFLGIISTQGEKYYFYVEGSTRDEIEPIWGDIEHQNKHWNKHPSWWGGMCARVGGRGPLSGIPSPYLVSHLPYLVSHLTYLVCHPLSGIPSPLSGIPYPYLVSHPINESPKWNFSLLNISSFIVSP